MKLYVHFGIYKAGSSYLQYILANARDYLLENKIFFPSSVQDKKMIKGLISPGNADGLEEALNEKNENAIHKLLIKWRTEAKNENCERVLISAEALVHKLAEKSTLELLLEGAKRAGYTEVFAMGFFRDLTDHAMSTYKHRAKSGKIPDYAHWIREVYETPQLLNNLIERRKEKYALRWTFRKFYKNSDSLKKAFFQDWLQVEVPQFSGRPTVNESITLSEVLVMNEVNKIFPNVTDYFVRDLKSLEIQNKAKDHLLEGHVAGVFSNQLMSYQHMINGFNAFMPEQEDVQLGMNDRLNSATITALPTPQLNAKQLELLLKRVAFFSSCRGIFILWRRKLFGLLPSGVRKKLAKSKFRNDQVLGI